MKKDTHNELPIPPDALQEEWAIELIRVWAAGGKQHISVATSVWDDPANWGILLVDLAKNMAKSYSEVDCDETLLRIKEGFDAEWESSTDDPS